MTRLLTLSPLLHILLCYIYLYLFQFGFGSNLYYLIKVEDIFNVGIGKIAPFYFITGIGFIFTYFWMDSEPLKIKNKEDFQIHPSLRTKPMRWIFISIPLMCLASVIITLSTQNAVMLNVAFMPLIVPIAYIASKIFETNDFRPTYRLALVMTSGALINLAANAYTDGFRARYMEYSYFSDNYARCKNSSIILYSRGDNYVAVEKNGQRVVLDDECKTILIIPSRKIKIEAI